MKKHLVCIIVSVIAVILFWTAEIVYGSYVGFHTELNNTHTIIAFVLTIGAYAATIISSIFISLALIDAKEI